VNRKTPEAGRVIRRKTASALMLGGLSLALGACAPQPEPEAKPSATGPAAEQTVEVRLSVAADAGEVPEDLLQGIIEDLTRQESLAVADIEVERAEAVIWPDGALGCPRPDEMYTHAEVPGYWIALHAEGQRYDYRAAAAGHFRRCDTPFKRRAPVG
jgi:hypothetical protein